MKRLVQYPTDHSGVSLQAATSSNRRRGFSLVELAVALAIVSLIAALLFPAVSQVRERSRALMCGNHVRQLGIALQHFEDVNGVFPTTQWLPGAVLPLMEESEPALLCPSDIQFETALEDHDFSYLLNDGTRFRIHDKNGFAAAYGFATPAATMKPRDTRVSDITDGLSQTVAASERLISSQSISLFLSEADLIQDPARYIWYVSKSYADEDELSSACLGADRKTPFPIAVWPTRWIGAGYTHILPPNAPGCYNEVASLDGNVATGMVAISSTSSHPNGVNSVMADGTTRSISSLIDLRVWRAIGTRNGGESASLR